METEFKYCLKDTSVFDKIISDKDLIPYKKGKNYSENQMHAVYFDTEDKDLMKAGIAYRIRYEDERIEATIKWDDSVEKGLHIRHEFNLVINDERFAKRPNIEAFKSSGAYSALYKAAGDKPLKKIVVMDYCRRDIKLDTGKSISALSVDEGVLHGVSNEIPVCELEIELYHGDDADFKKVAAFIDGRNELVPENRSKFQRALA